MVLRVFVPQDFAYLEALFPTKSQSNSAFVRERRREAAQIALSIPEDPNHIIVERFTSIFQCEPKARFHLPSDPALRLPNALSGIAHFNYFLEQRHQGVLSTPTAISPLNGVSLEVYRLEGIFPNRERNLVVDNKVSLKSDPALNYGIIIRNTTAYELFPYLFAFDATEYTIHVSIHSVFSVLRVDLMAQILYEPHARKAPLRSNSGEVIVGMGSQQALKFGPLPKDVNQSSTFLKLFVATKPIDIAWIQQAPPFDPRFEGHPRFSTELESHLPIGIAWIQQAKPFDPGFEGRPRFGRELESLPDTWDAFRITMTMTK
jgi:hypothetical protein